MRLFIANQFHSNVKKKKKIIFFVKKKIDLHKRKKKRGKTDEAFRVHIHMSEMESTILQIRECFVYQVPPLATGAGYKAKQWNLSQPLWSGQLAVRTRGSHCFVRLLNNDGSEFAVCPIRASKSGASQSVEKVLDSSRYFAMRISDGGNKSAVVGLGFNERSDAFDFSAALQDFEKGLRQERELAESRKQRASQPAVDYSLPQGKTISISLKQKAGSGGGSSSQSSSRRRRRRRGGNDSDSDDDSDPFALPPPPGSRSTTASTQQYSASSVPSSQPAVIDFGGPPAQQQPLQQDPLAGLLDGAPVQQPAQVLSPFSSAGVGAGGASPFSAPSQQPSTFNFGAPQQPQFAQPQLTPFGGGQPAPHFGQQATPFGGAAPQQFGQPAATPFGGAPQTNAFGQQAFGGAQQTNTFGSGSLL
jgi:adaptin ear-binding coat-associated protein 1/2